MKYSTESLIKMQCYVKYNLYYGQPKHKIREILIEQGWDKNEIDYAFRKAENIKEYIPPIKKPAKKKITIKEPEVEVPLPPTPKT